RVEAGRGGSASCCTPRGARCRSGSEFHPAPPTISPALSTSMYSLTWSNLKVWMVWRIPFETEDRAKFTRRLRLCPRIIVFRAFVDQLPKLDVARSDPGRPLSRVRASHGHRASSDPAGGGSLVAVGYSGIALAWPPGR